MQAGLFRNQETYAFLDPGQTIRFSEYWMPVRNTGGISRANKVGVVSLQSHGADVIGRAECQSSAFRVRRSVCFRMEGFCGNETADLSPEKLWSHTVPANGSWQS